MIDLFTHTPLLNLLLFIFSAIVIWFAGNKLAFYADLLSHKTEMGAAFLGALFVGAMTSLPEVATTISAAWMKNASLTINNLFGGIPLQTVILVFADILLVKEALTSRATKSILILNGVLLIVLLSLIILPYSLGTTAAFFHIGIWSLVIFLVYCLMLYVVHQFEKRNHIPLPPEKKKKVKLSNAQLWGIFFFYGFMVFVAGWFIAVIADVISIQYQIKSSVVGATGLALVTSLPEIATTFAAIRLRAYTLAFANIFGSNALMVALVFLGDGFYREGPILATLGKEEIFLVGLGILMTSIYLLGMLRKSKKTIFRMGYDSFLILIIYIAGLAFLLR